MTCIVHSSADLVCLVPYLVGFHPTESLVAVWIDDGAVRLTARVDLAATEHPDQLRPLLERMQHSSRGTSCFLLACSSDVPAARQAVLAAAELLPAELLDACVTDGERWWSALCDDPACCPVEGTPCDDATSAAVAAMVAAGVAPLPTRDDVAAALASPPDTPERERVADEVVRDVLGATAGLPERMDALLQECLGADEPGQPTLRQACQLAALLHDSAARDVAWGVLDEHTAPAMMALWRGVVAQVPEDMAAAPLCQLGMAAWVSGEGAVMSICLERAEVLDPLHPPVRLLADIIAAAAPPSLWRSMMVAAG